MCIVVGMMLNTKCWTCFCCAPCKSEFINHNQTFIPYLDVSILSRDLHQKKLVLSSSKSWCDDQLSHQESQDKV